IVGARLTLMSMAVNGGPIHPIDTNFPNVMLQDVSKDGQTLLVTSSEGLIFGGPLWTLPTHGGAPHRLGDAQCFVARWSPDNRRIACGDKTKIIVMDADGGNPRPVEIFSSPVLNLVWNPDGKGLRYVLEDLATHTNSQWEVAINDDGSPTQALNLGLGARCCMDWAWTHDGNSFFFTELDENGKSRLK